MITSEDINRLFKNYIINKPAFFLSESLYVRYIVFISKINGAFTNLKIEKYSKISVEKFPQFFIHKITVGKKQIMFQNGFRISRFIKGFEFAGQRMWRRYNIVEIIGQETPKAILDVGANIGEFSYYANSAFSGASKIIAVEPDPVVLNCLRFNLQGTSICIEPIAVSNKSNTSKFYLKPATADSSFHAPAGDSIEVNVVTNTLDSIVDKYGLGAPILVKMDCEGHEPEALLGLIVNVHKVKWISIDTGPERLGKSTTNEVLNILTQSGFTEITTYKSNIVTAVRTIKSF